MHTVPPLTLVTAIDPSKPESTPLLEALITSKKHASSAPGSKFSKHKPQHQHAGPSKPRAQEDDAHFSRAQPIVPSGPVTLLTSSKPDNASKSGAATANPTLSPTLSTKMSIQAKEPGVKGKGKGKAEAGEPHESQSKPGKGKNTPKKQAPPNDTANKPASVSEGTSKPKDVKTPPPSKKKKPPPSPGGDSTQNKSKDTGGEGADKGDSGPSSPSARGRGRGKGGSGRGGVVIVPKILTKIISEGSAAAGKGGPPPPAAAATTSSSEARDTPTVVQSTVSEPTDASAVDSRTAGGTKDNDNEPTPQSAPAPRGGERGRRPFYRGRGRGRGRGAARGAAANAAAS